MMAKGLYPPDEHEVADARSGASGKFSSGSADRAIPRNEKIVSHSSPFPRISK